jgi:hypothetical protein
MLLWTGKHISTLQIGRGDTRQITFTEVRKRLMPCDPVGLAVPQGAPWLRATGANRAEFSYRQSRAVSNNKILIPSCLTPSHLLQCPRLEREPIAALHRRKIALVPLGVGHLLGGERSRLCCRVSRHLCTLGALQLAGRTEGITSVR